MNVIIRLIDVAKKNKSYYGLLPVLEGVNLAIPRGSFIAIKGRSGSGKTTLLNVIGLLDSPTKGEIFVDDTSIGGLSEDDKIALRRSKFGYIFQSFALLPTYSAYENIEIALRIQNYDIRKIRERANQCLKAVGLSTRCDSRPDELSGGQKQRVAIARALAGKPEIILADEPTGELDSETTRKILRLLKRIASDHDITLILATHDPIVDEFADQIFKIENRRIIPAS